MIYRFDQFELDLAKAELRLRDLPVHSEPQVYALLALLIQNRDRLVSRDEIIDKVWGGRFISESAVSSRVKSLRQSLGDDGAQQRLIKTIHGRGFRFVGNVQISKTDITFAGDPNETAQFAFQGQPSIAILPFAILGDPDPFVAIGHALPHELIAGHHLQGFMNNRNKTYRKFGTPFWHEGNALYWEFILWDMKFPRSPEDRIGMLFWRMHRCARIIFSLNYHMGIWTPQQCIDFLVDRVGHERANAEGEVRRIAHVAFQAARPGRLLVSRARRSDRKRPSRGSLCGRSSGWW